MKIIERGRLAADVSHQLRCQKCGTLFEFQTKEATYVPDQRDGDFLQINCPLCKASCTMQAPRGSYWGPG